VGAPPLCLACQRGQPAAVSMLLSRGADVDATRPDGATAIIAASHHGSQKHLECVKLCSAYGAAREVRRVDLHGGVTNTLWHAEHAPLMNGQSEMRTWLEESRGWTALHHVEVLTVEHTLALLRSGACVHAPATGSYTASPPLTPHMCALRSLATGNGANEGGDDAASLITQRASPWCIKTHHLHPSSTRSYAVELCRIGYLLRNALASRSSSSSWTQYLDALSDVWLAHIIPRALAGVLHPGVTVLVSGLNGRTDLNGCIGRIHAASVLDASGRLRWPVKALGKLVPYSGTSSSTTWCPDMFEPFRTPHAHLAPYLLRPLNLRSYVF